MIRGYTAIALCMLVACGRPVAAAGEGAAGEGAPTGGAPTGGATAGGAASEPGDIGPFVLGTQTHFGQNWPASSLSLVRQAKVPALRDSVSWSAVETTSGRLDFDIAAAAPLHAFCRGGGDLLLTVQPTNPIYEGGRMVGTSEGLAAFGRYVGQLVRAFGPCLRAIEVGNEINGPRGLGFAPEVNPITGYVATLETAYRAAKAADPTVQVLGGSTNAIGTGFLARIFDAGGLRVMDGVVVHPYRAHPENVDVEIGRLATIMRAHGKVVPIWATEFSDNFPTAAGAAPHLVKMVTLLAAGPVSRAYWYALRDQRWFRNMGLYTAGGQSKPAALAMQLTQQRLLPAGRPRRIDVGDPNIFLFRYGGSGPLVLWGAPRGVRFAGPAQASDSVGRGLTGNAFTVGDEPIVVEGATSWTFDARTVLADSVLGYGQAPWSYLVRKPGGIAPLAMFDDRFSSYYGGANYRPLRLADTTGAPAGNAASGFRPVLRYTAPADQQVVLSACFTKKMQGDGVDVSITHGDAIVRQGVLTDRLAIDALPLALNKGDVVETTFGRHGAPGGVSFRYRVRILAAGQAVAPVCL